MDSESLKSALSEQSGRGRRGQGGGRLPPPPHHHHHSQAVQLSSPASASSSLHRGSTNHHSHRSHRSASRGRKEDACSPSSLPEEEGGESPGQEVIRVQILPQDENWGETMTALTGNTSERSLSMEEVGGMGRWGKEGGGSSSCVLAAEEGRGAGLGCQRYLGSAVAVLLVAAAACSPLAMVLLPHLGLLLPPSPGPPGPPGTELACDAKCDGQLLAMAFKLCALGVATWAVFWRPPRATMPRLFLLRALVLLLALLLSFAFWLFYAVRFREQPSTGRLRYYDVVVFAGSMLDCLLLLHYLAVALLHLRQLQPAFQLKVVRSPDGESCSLTAGPLSIQRAAVLVLDHYYARFPIYNPYLERLPVARSSRKSHLSSSSAAFKFYELDGVSPCGLQGRALLGSSGGGQRRRDSSHNERFYEEHEYERRVRKRRARLVTAAEEAFTHIRRLQEEPGPAIPLEPHEAAQAIFPSMARALQKYLRITRQQPRHSVEGILAHLALCLSHGLSPRAFLERYLVASPVLQSEKEQQPVQTWALICEELLSRSIRHGSLFQLRQNDVSLLVQVTRLPHFNVTEELIHPKANRFVLRLSSETSV